jgi:hypothetical protein
LGRYKWFDKSIKNERKEKAVMTLYFTGATLVFGLLLNAFLKDDTTPKTHIASWVVLAIATVFWPLTLPFMIRKRLQKEAPLELDFN